ncbi:RNase adapter RapZ [Kytococcus schroeteri]|uniref:RNase adapter RapZ n=1 Tax=Kytococcus schroeteri TaxID=138300 RepID=A0A2I1PE29_9MICO|nr:MULTISPECIES: RNase adapter RapZ [Kytococcus]PKZ42870.1 RNase adapter RapZ [Kytococcus schroeteri]
MTTSSTGGVWQAPRTAVVTELLRQAEQSPSGPHLGEAGEIAVVTGLSGAGRTTVTNVLEDTGWYVVDNLPPSLIGNLAAMSDRLRVEADRAPRLAVACTVPSEAVVEDLAEALKELRAAGWKPWVLYLDASEAELVRRYEAVRRPHPLQGQGRLLDGIRAERRLLGSLRATADVVVDTSGLNVHQLSAQIGRMVEPGEDLPRVSVMSFGFKYGLPLDADIVLDLRFLPNPYWVPELRAHNGTEAPVRDFVLAQEGALDFVERALDMLEPMVAGYRREHRRFVTLAVGCTGGKHRSVAITEELARRLAEREVAVRSLHRDLGRE